MTYRVTWDIDIEANSPKDAALLAREYQLSPESTATVFKVREHSQSNQTKRSPLITIDLMEDTQ